MHPFFKPLLVVCLITNGVLGDYECLCNYRVETPMLTSPDVNAAPAGYMYEFDCKAKTNAIGLPSDWYAVFNEHQIMFVKGGSQLEIQTCQGDIPEEDKLTTTQMKITTITSPTEPKTAEPTTRPSTATTSIPSTTHKPTTIPLTSTTQYSTITTTLSTTLPSTTTASITLSTTPSTITTPTTTHSTSVPTSQSTPSSTEIPSTLPPTTATAATPSSTTIPSTSPPQTTTTTTTSTRTSPSTTTARSTTTATILTSKVTTHKPITSRPSTTTTTSMTTHLPVSKQHHDTTTHQPAHYTKDHVTTPTTDWLTKWETTTDWLIKWSSHKPTQYQHQVLTTQALSSGHGTTHTPQGNLNRCPSHLLQVTNHKYLRQHNNHCYQLVMQYQTWFDAEQDCLSTVNNNNNRGELLEIKNDETQTFIMQFLNDVNFQHPVWIGLHDLDREEHFTWDSGAHVSYTHWDPNRKGNNAPHGQEDCVLLKANGLWDDSLCDGFMMNQNNHAWICQYPTHVPHHNG